MRLPDVLSAEERSQRWWIDWRSVDFTWASLESKHFGNNTEQEEGKKLQDYWRTDPSTGNLRNDDILIACGELEKDPRENLWHLVHVPLHWDDGTPTWKADRNHKNWKLFWQIIKARLKLASTKMLNFDPPSEKPEAATLSGIVFGDVPEDWFWDDLLDYLNAKFQTCAFLGSVSFYGVNSISELDLRHCLFCSTADFDEVNIKSDLRFDGAIFISHLKMLRAKVGGNLEMSRCSIHGELSLLNSRIKGNFQCNSSVFHAPCGFESTTFGAKVNVAWCRFLNVTSFASVRFRGGVALVQCRFAIDIAFTGRCYGDFHCIDCELKNAAFAFFIFRREALFSASQFKGSALFQRILFAGKTSFRNAVFESDTCFKSVRFSKEVEFHNAVFDGVADLSGCRLPEEARFHHCAFRGADFRRTADFTIERFSAWGAFTECTFHQRVLFSRRTLTDPSSFEVAFETADYEVAAIRNSNRKARKVEEYRRFSELEAAFQALKQGMARQMARLDEHRFYRLELLARKRYSHSKIERSMIWLYDVSSLCGTSFVRPLLLLLVLIILFGFGYWATTQTPNEFIAALNPIPVRQLDPNFIDAVRFSVKNTFQPMSVWKSSLLGGHSRHEWVKEFLSEGDAISFLLARLTATIQSMLTITLLFLAALGFKRHFQMGT